MARQHEVRRAATTPPPSAVVETRPRALATCTIRPRRVGPSSPRHSAPRPRDPPPAFISRIFQRRAWIRPSPWASSGSTHCHSRAHPRRSLAAPRQAPAAVPVRFSCGVLDARAAGRRAVERREARQRSVGHVGTTTALFFLSPMPVRTQAGRQPPVLLSFTTKKPHPK
jgi:hypothetical protein